MNLDRALDAVRNAFVRHDGEMDRNMFRIACENGGAYSKGDQAIVQATFEACGLRVHRPAGRALSTDIFRWTGFKERYGREWGGDEVS